MTVPRDRITVQVDKDLADQIDDVRSARVNRTEWIRRAIQLAVADQNATHLINGGRRLSQTIEREDFYREWDANSAVRILRSNG